MGIILDSSWKAFKAVSYMYIAGAMMSLMTIISAGDTARVFVHAGWGFLAVSLFLQATWEYLISFRRDTKKDRINQKIGVNLSSIGLILSVFLSYASVDSSIKSTPISFPFYPTILWFTVAGGTVLRYFSLNVLLQRESGRYT